jgi:hypothetical protein
VTSIEHREPAAVLIATFAVPPAGTDPVNDTFVSDSGLTVGSGVAAGSTVATGAGFADGSEVVMGQSVAIGRVVPGAEVGSLTMA